MGFGVCRRLLFQLALSSPTDALPVFGRTGPSDAGIAYPCGGVTLVMACRSQQKAEAARTQLLELFDTEVEKSELHRNHPHVQAFRRNIVIDIHLLDLASVQSALHFCSEVKSTCVPTLIPAEGGFTYISFKIPLCLSRHLQRWRCTLSTYQLATLRERRLHRLIGCAHKPAV